MFWFCCLQMISFAAGNYDKQSRKSDLKFESLRVMNYIMKIPWKTGVMSDELKRLNACIFTRGRKKGTRELETILT